MIALCCVRRREAFLCVVLISGALGFGLTGQQERDWRTRGGVSVWGQELGLGRVIRWVILVRLGSGVGVGVGRVGGTHIIF